MGEEKKRCESNKEDEMIARDSQNGWTVRNVTLEIRSGRNGWWQMRVGGKKFIVREVREFEKTERKSGQKVGASRREEK